MNYIESYMLDWLPAGLLASGLDVQLPGSDLLLSPQDEYLVEPATTLFQETKNQPKPDFLDCFVEDDLIGFDNAAGDFFDDNFGLDVDNLLPSSPEIISYNLNNSNVNQDVGPAVFNRKPSKNCEKQVPISTSVPDVSNEIFELLTDTVQDNVFKAGHLDDIVSDWLLPPVPILPFVSPEEVESVLSAPPGTNNFSLNADQVPLVLFESEAQYDPEPTGFGDAQLESFQIPGSPLTVVLTSIPAQQNPSIITGHPIQVPQNVTWNGESSLGSPVMLGGFVAAENTTTVIAASPASLSSLTSSPVGSPSTSEESGYDSAPKAVRSDRAGVRSEPYPTSGVKPERRERKREQNKTAALKYRQKKRTQQGLSTSECEQLEKRNFELKSRAEELTREIAYLKGLISEIYSSETD